MYESIYRKSVNAIHKFLGKSRILNRIAISLYFYAKRIFKYHLADSPNISKNGEELIVIYSDIVHNNFSDIQL